MKTPLYILGILKKFGPQHGYQIKKIFSTQISDFAQIKLPVIYYHLEKMEAKGLVCSRIENDQGKKEKVIYTITPEGEEEFQAELEGILGFNYRPEFLNDALFYFIDFLAADKVELALRSYAEKLEASISMISEHREALPPAMGERALTMSRVIFDHHEHHYKAELEWATMVLKQL